MIDVNFTWYCNFLTITDNLFISEVEVDNGAAAGTE